MFYADHKFLRETGLYLTGIKEVWEKNVYKYTHNELIIVFSGVWADLLSCVFFLSLLQGENPKGNVNVYHSPEITDENGWVPCQASPDRLM